MAIAQVTCTCEKCGERFTVKTKQRNRQTADQWEEWAAGNYTLCRSCYIDQEREYTEKNIDSNKYEIIEIHYGKYKNEYNNCKTVPGTYNPETKTIKVIIEKEIPMEERVKTAAKFASEMANSTKSKVFSMAHKLAKYLVNRNPGISYQATFSQCLKEVYRLIRLSKEFLNSKNNLSQVSRDTLSLFKIVK